MVSPHLNNTGYKDFTMRNESFQRRLDMMEALEVTHDDARLNELVLQDQGPMNRLGEYHTVLRRTCSLLKDPIAAEKLLTLPVLDQADKFYQYAVHGVFATLASEKDDVDPTIVDLLQKRLGDNKDDLTASLSMIFSNAATANVGQVYFKPELAQILVDAGADIERAHQIQAMGYEMQKAEAERRLRQMQALKDALIVK
jgi:hypothetical protein